MALVLGLEKQQGFRVGDINVTVTHIVSPTEFNIKTEQKTVVAGYLKVEDHTITDQEATEIAPDIMISCGSRGTVDVARVCIDAPKSIPIVRDHKGKAS